MDSPIYKALQSLIHHFLHGDVAPLLLSILFIAFIALILLFVFLEWNSSKGKKTQRYYKVLDTDDTYKGQKCPLCKLVSPPRAERCSCGHKFPKVEKILGDGFVMIGKPYNGPYERWRKFGNREKGKKQFKPEG